MKLNKLTLITVIASISLLGNGCAMFGSGDKKETCQTAQASLAAYLAVVNAGGTPSADEARIAAGATAFLAAFCGWTPAGGSSPPKKAGSASRGEASPDVMVSQVDAYGVPIIVPPR